MHKKCILLLLIPFVYSLFSNWENLKVSLIFMKTELIKWENENKTLCLMVDYVDDPYSENIHVINGYYI